MNAVFERLNRSWAVTLQCLAVLRADRSLLLFPLFSVVALVLIIASFAAPMLPMLRTLAHEGRRSSDHATPVILLFLFYFVQFSVMNFFNTALVEVALRRFDGEAATVGDGLRRAWKRLPVILAYSVIAATVGTVLHLVIERLGLIGRIVTRLIGLAWLIATSLVVPVLAAEDIGPLEAISRSTELVRNTWGEQLIGNIGIRAAFGILLLFVFLIGGFVMTRAASASPALGIAIGAALVVGVSIILLVQMTLQAIYSAALYRYADGDAASGGIDRDLLGDAFRAGP